MPIGVLICSTSEGDEFSSAEGDLIRASFVVPRWRRWRIPPKVSEQLSAACGIGATAAFDTNLSICSLFRAGLMFFEIGGRERSRRHVLADVMRAPRLSLI